ncbi:MAG: beta strand repeat-containing protein, partial [Vicinamibacterales bacterium]
LDAGAGQGSPANLFRDATVVPNGAFGTITFRRTFTNNTGNSLPFLRYRIVNTSTNPPVGAAADLRALSSTTGSVLLSGGGSVNVAGTTLESPPTQSVGGGFNASLSASSVALATPLASGASTNLAFTFGVQVTGTYNVCLVAEGSTTATGSSVMCFTGSTENTPPSITPSPVSSTAGAAGSSSTIATVSDLQDAPGTLTVTVVSQPAGITVTGISNTTGTITATVTAGPTAVGGPYNVILQVADSEGATENGTLVVTVIPATPTITPGGPTTFCAGGSVTLTSSAAAGNQWLLNGNPIGGETNQTFVASASGDYTVTVTENGSTSAPSAITTVTVNPTPPTPTITPGGPTTFCAGGSVTLTSSSASGNQWFLNGNPIGGATNQTYVATVAGNYTVVVTASGCSSAASATTTVTINPNPDATITTPSSTISGSTGNIASVASAGAGATYNWGITNGTITAGTGTNSITYTAGAPGSLSLNVTVTTAAGCSDTKSANVTVTAPAVTVTSVSPAAGTVAGNSAVTINGTGFNAGASVTFGGSAATNVVVVSAIKITARTPAHALGSVNVTVTNTDTSTGTLTNGYLYKAQQFDPNNDGTITSGDIFYLVNFLYMGGPPPNGASGLLSGDANGDGLVDSADIFYLVNYLFLGGPRPNAIPTSPLKTSAAAGSMSGS